MSSIGSGSSEWNKINEAHQTSKPVNSQEAHASQKAQNAQEASSQAIDIAPASQKEINTFMQGIKGTSLTKLPDDIFSKLYTDPKKVINNLRESQGAERDSALINFQDDLNKMNNPELKEARDYIVKLMTDPNNKDDEFLGVLLNTVNKELDSRGPHHNIIKNLNDPRFLVD